MVNASRGELRMFRYLICLSFLSRPNARILRASCRFNVVSKIGDTLVKANEWDKRTRRQRHFSPARRQLKMTFCKIFYFTNNDCRLNCESRLLIKLCIGYFYLEWHNIKSVLSQFWNQNFSKSLQTIRLEKFLSFCNLLLNKGRLNTLGYQRVAVEFWRLEVNFDTIL